MQFLMIFLPFCMEVLDIIHFSKCFFILPLVFSHLISLLSNITELILSFSFTLQLLYFLKFLLFLYLVLHMFYSSMIILHIFLKCFCFVSLIFLDLVVSLCSPLFFKFFPLSLLHNFFLLLSLNSLQKQIDLKLYS